MISYTHEHCVLLSMHTSDVIDSSGLRFYYSGTPREHRAGVLFLGHTVTEYMMIPPKVKSYTVAGLCHQNCTQSVSLYTCVPYIYYKHNPMTLYVLALILPKSYVL